MEVKTNAGLAAYAKKALAEGWGYVWGTFGYVLTQELFDRLLKDYPDNVGDFKQFITDNWLGKRVTDCVGLIKSYLYHSNGEIIYKAALDVNANQMYELAIEKGTIGDIPERPGVCVYKKGHIGVYIGGGWVIEARGTRYGVVKTPLKGKGANTWTHWLQCPFIQQDREEPKVETVETVKVNGKEYSDIAGHWAKDSIVKALELGLLNGDGDKTFDPDKPVTRAQLAVVAVNVYNKIKGV